MGRLRLDTRLVAEGLAPTRARARDLIQRGYVRAGGVVCVKPAHMVPPDMALSVADDAPAYVSRGAEKLAAALDHFGFDVTGCEALDIGASTGGFTQVLLARGAVHVTAVDVGHSQLHDSLRRDPRVTVLEQQDARTLTAEIITRAPRVIVADVSFISLTKALGPGLALAATDAVLVALIKPQFEVGRDHIGSGGIVRDAAQQQRACDEVSAWLGAQSGGWRVSGIMPSPILGGSGNAEFLLGARRNG